MDAYGVESVRALEAAAIARLGDEDVLMQRAAAGLAAAVARELVGLRGRVYGTKVLVMVGPGNNGGDALFAGARLARRGVAVTAVRCLGEPHARGLAALLAAGGRVIGIDDLDVVPLGQRRDGSGTPTAPLRPGRRRGARHRWAARAARTGRRPRRRPGGERADADRGRRPALRGGRGHRRGAGGRRSRPAAP